MQGKQCLHWNCIWEVYLLGKVQVVETQALCPWFILWEGQFCSAEPEAFCQFPTVVFIPWPFSCLTPLPPQGWETVKGRWSYCFLDTWLLRLLYITLWLTRYLFFFSENTLHANLCALADHNINACPLIQCLPVCLSSPCSPAFSCFTFLPPLSLTLLNTIHLSTTAPGCGNRGRYCKQIDRLH